MGKTKTSPRQDTADVGHDPAAEERATKSVADSMNATPNSSNQGNKKKKTKNESPATTAKADSVQNLRGNGSKQVTVGKPAEISHDRMTQESSASSTNKNEILATSTKDSDKGPDAVKGADESVATNMNAARNSSSQGNDKKKREKELAAAAARDVSAARKERVAALVELQSQLKWKVGEGLKEKEVTLTGHTKKDRLAGIKRLAEDQVKMQEIFAQLNKSSEKNSKEKTGQPAVVTQESAASAPAAETKVNSMEEANVAVRNEDDKVSAADDKGGSRAKATEDRIKALEKLRSSNLESARWMTSLPKRRNSFGKFRLFEESE